MRCKLRTQVKVQLKNEQLAAADEDREKPGGLRTEMESDSHLVEDENGGVLFALLEAVGDDSVDTLETVGGARNIKATDSLRAQRLAKLCHRSHHCCSGTSKSQE